MTLPLDPAPVQPSPLPLGVERRSQPLSKLEYWQNNSAKWHNKTMTQQTQRSPQRDSPVSKPSQRKSGPSYQSVQQISTELGLNRAEIRRIFAIPERTQARYDKTNPPLQPAIADRLERFQRLYQQAVDLFEDETEARNWLTQSTPPALEGQTPLAALATDAGSKKVEQILYRAEYGMFG